MANVQSSKGQELSGIVGFYDSPQAVVSAMEKVRDQNYRRFDAFTPYPIHGMDDAMGLKRSPLPYLTFLAGITGTICAFGLQYWTSAINWPINVGGKPFNSWPAFVPVMFELTILFAGIATFVGLIGICRLPNTKHAAFDPSITCDRFAIFIGAPPAAHSPHEAEDPKEKQFKAFQAEEAMQLLQSTGAKDVRKVFAEGWF